MKNKFYTVTELKEMGKARACGFGELTISIVNPNQLTIYECDKNQMTIFDLQPKRILKRRRK